MFPLISFALALPLSLQAPSLETSLQLYQAWRGSESSWSELGDVRIKSTVRASWTKVEYQLTEWLGTGYRSQIELKTKDQVVQRWGYDGTLAWEERHGTAKRLSGRWASALVRLTGCIYACPWNEFYGSVQLGKHGTETEGLVLDLTPHPPEKLGFAPDTSPLPVQADRWILNKSNGALQSYSSTVLLPQGKMGRITQEFSDWRVVGGVRFPFHRRLSIEQDGDIQSMVMEIQDVGVQLHFFVPPYSVPDKLRRQAQED